MHFLYRLCIILGLIGFCGNTFAQNERQPYGLRAFSIGSGNQFDQYTNYTLDEFKQLAGKPIDDSQVNKSIMDTLGFTASTGTIFNTNVYIQRKKPDKNTKRFGAFVLGTRYVSGQSSEYVFRLDSGTSKEYAVYTLSYNEFGASGAYQYNLRLNERFFLFLEANVSFGFAVTKRFRIASERHEQGLNGEFSKIPNEDYAGFYDVQYPVANSLIMRGNTVLGLKTKMSEQIEIVFRTTGGQGSVRTGGKRFNVGLSQFISLDIKYYLR